MKLLRVGTTEGRFRMIMPELIREFQKVCPDIQLDARIGNAEQLREMLVSGDLDLAFSGISPMAPECISKEMVFDERLYLVISDDLMKKYFAEDYAECIEAFQKGADLRRFQGIPFCRSLPNLHCMQILDHVLESYGITLNCIHVSGHFDLHQELAVSNYAACFCLSMYVPHLRKMNEMGENKLHLFPILDLNETNPVYLLRNQEREEADGREVFAGLVRDWCRKAGN